MFLAGLLAFVILFSAGCGTLCLWADKYKSKVDVAIEKITPYIDALRPVKDLDIFIPIWDTMIASYDKLIQLKQLSCPDQAETEAAIATVDLVVIPQAKVEVIKAKRLGLIN
jgi:hypothetical protein